MKNTIRWFGILVGMCWLLLAADESDEVKQKARSAQIGPEDTITISALDAEELNKSWRVSVTGDVSLPLIGRMHVAGMTVEEFEKDLAQRMRRYYRDPQVSAYVSEFRSKPVTVTGAVDKPGTQHLDGPKSLFDVLVQAGGPKEQNGKVMLMRPKEEGPIPAKDVHSDARMSVAEIPIKDVMAGKGEAANIQIKPHDVVSVSPAQAARLVHVAGQVTKPGAVELVTQDTVSVAKVIAMAGGLAQGASAKKTVIIHVNEAGVKTSTAYIDLNKVLKGEVKDIELTGGDLVFVPTNQIMGIVQAASQSAVTTGVYLLGRL